VGDRLFPQRARSPLVPRPAHGLIEMAIYRNLRRRPVKPALNNGRVQRAIRRAFLMEGREVLSSDEIYDYTHARRRMQHKKLGSYCQPLRTLRSMCVPIRKVPPHGAWLWRLRNSDTDTR
jgi:hypothetical protein